MVEKERGGRGREGGGEGEREGGRESEREEGREEERERVGCTEKRME